MVQSISVISLVAPVKKETYKDESVRFSASSFRYQSIERNVIEIVVCRIRSSSEHD